MYILWREDKHLWMALFAFFGGRHIHVPITSRAIPSLKSRKAVLCCCSESETDDTSMGFIVCHEHIFLDSPNVVPPLSSDLVPYFLPTTMEFETVKMMAL